jgi:phenylalanyl-tRNA synthetase beta chain
VELHQHPQNVSKLKISSEAAYRFSRGVHPALAETGVRLALKRMAEWGGGQVAQGLIDNYPNPPVTRWSPYQLIGSTRAWARTSAQEMADILSRLAFDCEVDGDSITAHTPPHRLDINEGMIGRADLLEEISRIYGYDKIPSQRLNQPLPPQIIDPGLVMQETCATCW